MITKSYNTMKYFFMCLRTYTNLDVLRPMRLQRVEGRAWFKIRESESTLKFVVSVGVIGFCELFINFIEYGMARDLVDVDLWGDSGNDGFEFGS